MVQLLDHRGQPIEVKAQTSRDQYLDTSISVRDGFGYLGSKPRPFNFEAAVKRFRSWVYSAAMLNAMAVASIPLRLYIKKRRGRKVVGSRAVPMSRKRWLLGDGGDHRPSRHTITKLTSFGDDFEEVTDDHIVLSLLRKVNPYFNGFDLTTLRILHGELTGNAYMHPIISARWGVPVELWPMFPQWTWVIPDEREFIRGYVYGRDQASQMEFAPDEVIHFKRPNPNDLHYGLGKVEAAWSVVGLQEAKREMDTALYDNYARPDYLVVVKSGADSDAMDRFESAIEEKLRGTRKHGRFLTITGEVDVKPLNFTPEEMGDPEEVVEEIASVFGVPVTKLKANDPNRANAETGDAGWMKDTVNPLASMDCDALNQALLPLFGIEDDAVLAYDDPVPKNRQFALERSRVFVTSAITTVNEARVEEGYEPIEGGDTLRFNGTPIEALGRETPVQPPFSFTLPSAAAPREDRPDVPVEAAKPVQPPREPMGAGMADSVINVLGRVADGTMPVRAATLLLVEMGVAEPRAREMVEAMGSVGKREVETTPNPRPKDDEGSGADVRSKGVGPHKRSSVQVQIEGESAAALLSLHARIPNDVLTGDGRESEPHITALYGIETSNPRDLTQAVELFQTLVNGFLGPMSIGFRDVQKFEADEHDVLYVAVESPALVMLNSVLRNSVEYTNSYPDYKPHFTLAYVKPGSCDDLLGTKAECPSFTFDRLVFSAADGKRTIIRLNAGVPELADKGAEPVEPCCTPAAEVKQSDLWASHKSETMRDDESERQIQQLLNAIATVLAAAEAELLSALDGEKAVKMTQREAERILASMGDSMKRDLERAVTEFIERIIAQGGSAAMAGLGAGLSFDVVNPAVVEFIRNYTIRLAGEVSSHTIQRLSQVIADQIARGGTIRDIARAVRDVSETLFGRDRAETIARTESARAYTEGQLEGWKQSGLVEGRTPLLSPDACEFCEAWAAEFEGKSVPLDQPFYRRGDRIAAGGKVMVLDYSDVQGPPIHPRCRCDTIAVLKEA